MKITQSMKAGRPKTVSKHAWHRHIKRNAYLAAHPAEFNWIKARITARK